MLDRGLLYGDGFFDTLLWRNGTCAALPYHDARLKDAASALGIPMNGLDVSAKREAFFQTLQEDSVVRTTLTRGLQEQRGLWPSAPLEPQIYFNASPWTRSLIGTPVRVLVASTRRNAHSGFSAFKTLNYLENILAAREAAEQNADDALMLNTDNVLTGTTIANVWWVENGVLHTPPLSVGAVRGTLRVRVMETMPVVEKAIAFQQLPEQTIFLTSNAVRGFRPIINAALAEAFKWSEELNQKFFA